MTVFHHEGHAGHEVYKGLQDVTSQTVLEHGHIEYDFILHEKIDSVTTIKSDALIVDWKRIFILRLMPLIVNSRARHC